MQVPLPIPIATKNVAEVHGSVWKFVDCERCRQSYAYLMELSAVGEHHDILFLDGQTSAALARAKAQENLDKKSRNCILAVPCPDCGHYQESMAKQMKEDAAINWRQTVGAALVIASMIPFFVDGPYSWAISLVLGIPGLIWLVCGFLVAHHFDANAGDPSARIALGRQYAVWGERLVELRTALARVEAANAELARAILEQGIQEGRA